MKLSVIMATYNHEKYIEQAIRSVIAQQTNFPFELLIGEDCSTDRTRDVIDRLAREFPDRLKPEFNSPNLGLFANYRRLFARATGEYMAFLEGDDYWIGTEKLQRQVDFLDGHPECVGCFHDTRVFQDDGSGPEELFRPNLKKEFFDELDVFDDLFLHSSALVARTQVVRQIPDRETEKVLGDWPFFMFLLKFGRFGRITGSGDGAGAVWSAHRKHAAGVWNRTQTEQRIKDLMDIFDWANELYGRKHDRFIRAMKKHWTIHLRAEAKILELQQQLADARRASTTS